MGGHSSITDTAPLRLAGCRNSCPMVFLLYGAGIENCQKVL